MEEFKMPLNEGPVPTEPIVVKRFAPGESGRDFSKIKREELSYLGEWNRVMEQEGYGVMYRLGIKDGERDSDGDLASLVLFYAVPFAKRGMEMTSTIEERLYAGVRNVMEQSVLRMSMNPDCPTIVAALVAPPEYMLKELKKLYGKVKG